MQRSPFCHHPQSATRKSTAENGQGIDVNEYLVFTVLGVEVRRIVIVVEDLDDDPVKAADLRHPRRSGKAP